VAPAARVTANLSAAGQAGGVDQVVETSRASWTTLGATDDVTFITGMKSNHPFAIEYTVRLLSIAIRHHGPILHGPIHGELSKAAVKDFRGYLEILGDFPRPPAGMHYA
jgi:hypothetical protein